MTADDDTIQFRGQPEKEAMEIVDRIRPEEINVSELARQGLQAKLRETLSDDEKIMIHQLYERGALSDDVAAILLGDALDEIEREREAFEAAMGLETTGVFQE